MGIHLDAMYPGYYRPHQAPAPSIPSLTSLYFTANEPTDRHCELPGPSRAEKALRLEQTAKIISAGYSQHPIHSDMPSVPPAPQSHPQLATDPLANYSPGFIEHPGGNFMNARTRMVTVTMCLVWLEEQALT